MAQGVDQGSVRGAGEGADEGAKLGAKQGATAAAGGAVRGSPLEVFWAFLRLGLTSFGGPVAHLGFFREAFVARRKWFTDAAYADLVALAQFLPGPASSQVGLAIGLSRAGYLGALAAWTAFTLPSAVLLAALALGLGALEADGGLAGAGWLDGLKAAAVAVVAQAVWGMGRTLCPDRLRLTLAAASAGLALFLPGVVGQLAAIGLGLALGLTALRGLATPGDGGGLQVPISKAAGAVFLLIFFALLIALPLLAAQTESRAVDYADSFYRSGALVFGGGHVVLPLLEAEVVEPGWLEAEVFIAGYGAAQAVPGPLFTFSAFLGASMEAAPTGWLGAALCLAAIFLPSALLVFGALPFWDGLRRQRLARAALTGVNAAVVGLLIAALYDPVFLQGVTGPETFVIALAALVALEAWKVPAWAVVALAAAVGGIWPLASGWLTAL